MLPRTVQLLAIGCRRSGFVWRAAAPVRCCTVAFLRAAALIVLGLAALVWLIPAAPLTGDGQHYIAFVRNGLQHGASSWHERRLLGPLIVRGLPLEAQDGFFLLTLTSLAATAFLTWMAAREVLIGDEWRALAAIPLLFGTWVVAPNLREFGAVGHLDGETPGRCKPMRLAVRNAGGIEALQHPFGKSVRQRQQRARRQFLGAQLKQKIAGRHQAASGEISCLSSGKPSASRLSRYASATPRASVRTRRMKRWRSVTETACRASRRLNECEAFTICS